MTAHPRIRRYLIRALAALGMADARVATALNGNFVAASARGAARLSPGDALEIVAPMQGG